jgi:formate hydrogenlyase subunit 3/multisubunit Na+/H+ antiporter MnhD subunit
VAFLVVVLVLLALSYAGAAIHAKFLINKGENKGDIERKIVQTGAAIMVLGVLAVLFAWPAGKPWYKAQPFTAVYSLSEKYIKPAKDLPPSQRKEAEAYDVTIRQVLIGAVTCILLGIGAQTLIQTQAKGLANASSGGRDPKAPRSPWSGQTY